MAFAAELTRLSRFRVRGEQDLALASVLRPMAKALRASARQRGDVVERWQAAAPDHIRAGVELGRMVRGELTLHCPGAPARALVDRWLRGGGHAALAKAGIARVRTTVTARRRR